MSESIEVTKVLGELKYRTSEGKILTPPAGWDVLPPGDAGLTRRVKAAGPTWTVIEWVRRQKRSLGVWAAVDIITREKAKLDAERATPAYVKKLAASREKRAAEQADYVEDFGAAVLSFLDFHPRHADLGTKLAQAVTTHATPVGSGTVARTGRIPLEERAEAAVIAWMRHQTTAYDSMTIARIKGERRAVRRQLAERSRQLLHRYRRDETPPPNCPLLKALN